MRPKRLTLYKVYIVRQSIPEDHDSDVNYDDRENHLE